MNRLTLILTFDLDHYPLILVFCPLSSPQYGACLHHPAVFPGCPGPAGAVCVRAGGSLRRSTSALSIHSALSPSGQIQPFPALSAALRSALLDA